MSDNTPSSDAQTPVDASATTALVPLSDERAPTRHCARALNWAVLVMVLALVLALGWLYWQWQTMHAQWSQTLAQHHTTLAQTQAQAQRALDAAAAQAASAARLQADQERMAMQVQDLEHAFQALAPRVAHDTPALLLAEVGVLVEMAQQSLRLGDNVSTALIALESAHSRLQSSQALPDVAQALQQDIERLRALPVVDVAHLNARLKTLSALLADAPLSEPLVGSAPQDARPAAPPDIVRAPVDAPWWQVAWHDVHTWSLGFVHALAQELRSLVVVQRMDPPATRWLAPDQAALVRASLQSRVASARLALLMRETSIWTTELGAMGDGLQAHFDTRQTQVQEAHALLRTLLQTPIRVHVPGLASVRAVQARRERG